MKKLIKLFPSLLLIAPSISLAQRSGGGGRGANTGCPSGSSQQGLKCIPDTVTSAEDLIAKIDLVGNWLFTALLAVAVIFIILAAYDYMTSGGDSEKVGKAHKRLIYAAVGIAVAFLAKGIVNVMALLVT